MIRIKLNKNGGYIVGDGECPFDPERFMHFFINAMVRHNLRELDLTEFEARVVVEDVQREMARAPVEELTEENAAGQIEQYVTDYIRHQERRQDVQERGVF
jgi:hypothetical protein